MASLTACQDFWFLWRSCSTTGPRSAPKDAVATGPVQLPLSLHCSEQYLMVVKKWGAGGREIITPRDCSLRIFTMSKNNHIIIFFLLGDWKTKWYFSCIIRFFEPHSLKDCKDFILYFWERLKETFFKY